jgi:hypothetical protein
LQNNHLCRERWHVKLVRLSTALGSCVDMWHAALTNGRALGGLACTVCIHTVRALLAGL